MKQTILCCVGLLFIANTSCSSKLHESLTRARPMPKLAPKAAIVAINSIKEADFKTLDQNALVVFDLVDTLLFSDPSDYNPKLKPTNDLSVSVSKDDDLTDAALSRYMLKLQRRLVEPEHAQFIRILQHKGIKVIVLSHYLVGSYQEISNLQEWRFHQLHKLGINASSAFAQETIILDSFDSYKGAKPTYYKGILFTNNYSKGEVLSAFLDKVACTPSMVVCIDDNIDYLESVKKHMAQRNISFQGYHYTRVENLKAQKPKNPATNSTIARPGIVPANAKPAATPKPSQNVNLKKRKK